MNNTYFPDVMVDIETTGTSPDRTAIIQIAAVRFNKDTGLVDPNYFEGCLRIPAHRFWDESTRDWWLGQKQEVLIGIFEKARPHEAVMEEFRKWVLEMPGSPIFWGKPTHFDYSFIASYFKDLGWANPFHYRYANDMNSFIRALWFTLGKTPPDLEATLEFVGDAHNAVWDTFHQVKVLLEHIRLVKSGGLDLIEPQQHHCGTIEKGAGNVIDVG